MQVSESFAIVTFTFEKLMALGTDVGNSSLFRKVLIDRLCLVSFDVDDHSFSQAVLYKIAAELRDFWLQALNLTDLLLFSGVNALQCLEFVLLVLLKNVLQDSSNIFNFPTDFLVGGNVFDLIDLGMFNVLTLAGEYLLLLLLR